MLTTGVPLCASFAARGLSACSAAPPEETWAFFSASPPNATNSSQCSTTLGQLVTRPVNGEKVPITRQEKLRRAQL